MGHFRGAKEAGAATLRYDGEIPPEVTLKASDVLVQPLVDAG